MGQKSRRVERSIVIYSENQDVIPTIYLKPLAEEDLFLTESNHRVGLGKLRHVNNKNGHFLIESIPKTMISKYKNQTFINGEMVFIKKYYSDTCICMNSDGSIYTQETQSHSNITQCGWYLEKTAFGVRFISFFTFEHPDRFWYLAICNNRHLSVCRHIGDSGAKNVNTFWTISTISPEYRVQIPYPLSRHHFNYQTLLSSINTKSILLCNNIKQDLTKVAFQDVEDSVKIISETQTTMAYLRLFLLSHPETKDNISLIFNGIKEIITFYGHKMRKKIYRLFKDYDLTSQCSSDYLRSCTSFRNRKWLIKTRRHSFFRINRNLIKLLLPITKLSYVEKMKWYRKGDFLDFVREVLRISLPSKSQLMKASFFLLQYTDAEDIFKVDAVAFKQSKYFDFFFARKVEELSFLAAISLRNSSIQILEDVYGKLTLLNNKNLCFKTIVQSIHRHSKCSTKFYLEPCVTFSSKNRLFKS